MNVAYLGVPGAYSEQACIKYFGNDTERIGCASFDELFESVKNETTTYACVPIENTITGSVIANFDNLSKENVQIVGEVLLPIQHHLLAPPGTTLESVNVAHSHPVALGQCMRFLKQHNITPQSSFNTAGAAEHVAQNNQGEEAAIASSLCIDLYNLESLASDIQDTDNNTTRFLIVTKKETTVAIEAATKTSIVFGVKHEAGSLVQVLQRLEKYSINLTKLESRPIPQNPFEYIFFVDFQGGIQDENVKNALADIEAITTSLTILGSYPEATL